MSELKVEPTSACQESASGSTDSEERDLSVQSSCKTIAMEDNGATRFFEPKPLGNEKHDLMEVQGIDTKTETIDQISNQKDISKEEEPFTLRTLPMELISIIFGLVAPLGLLQLSWTSKQFRGILRSRSSGVIWEHSRSLLVVSVRDRGLPERPDDLSEAEYADLMFGTHCYFCTQESTTHIPVFTSFSSRTKGCKPCLDKNKIFLNEEKQDSFTIACDKWSYYWRLGLMPEKKAIIVEYVKSLGWADEFAKITKQDDEPQNCLHECYLACWNNVRMTAAVLEDLEPLINARMRKLRERRLAKPEKEHKALTRAAVPAMLEFLKNCSIDLPPDGVSSREFVTFFYHPMVQKIIHDNISRGGCTAAHFEPVRAILPEIALLTQKDKEEEAKMPLRHYTHFSFNVVPAWKRGREGFSCKLGCDPTATGISHDSSSSMLYPTLVALAFLRSQTGLCARPYSEYPRQSSTTFDDLLSSQQACICTDQRSLSEIIWSCFATIFACSWVSVHPNIPPPSDGRVMMALRRLELMFWSIICPELVIFWALKQWIGARNLAKRYQKHGWTRTHGYFLQMGGFMLYRGGVAVGVLDPRTFGWGLYDGKIIMPTITEKEIKDRSKADGLSKALVISQVIWFVLQCFARIAQGLEVTQLELVTLAFAALNGIMYFLWWNKPLDVQSTKKVFLLPGNRHIGTQTEFGYDGTRKQGSKEIRTSQAAFLSSEIRQFHNFTPSSMKAHTPVLNDDGDFDAFVETKNIINLRSLLAGICGFLITVGNRMRDIGSTNDVPGSSDMHVPTFYAHEFIPEEEYTDRRFSIIPLLGIVFGGIHCAGWNFFLPSHIETIIWRVGSCVITAFPIPILLVIIVVTFFNRLKGLLHVEGLLNGNHPWVSRLLVSLPLVYVVARLVLLVEALVSLRKLPPGAYNTVEWLSFLPHI